MTREEILNEKWLPIPGYEGLYDVSSMGRVRSYPTKRRSWVKEYYGYKKQGGYMWVALYKDGNVKEFSVHRLVGKLFVHNPNENEFRFINHKDEDKTNNKASNLEWCDASYNNTYGSRIERTQLSHIKRNSCRARKRIAQYTKDGVFVAEYPSIRAANIGVGRSIKSTSIIQSITHRDNQEYAYGYKWILL